MVEARFERIGRKAHLPRIESNWKRMLICQPPIKHMKVQTYCYRFSMSDNEELIHSDTYLTVGDLCERAKRVLAGNVSCPPYHNHSATSGYQYRGDERQLCEIAEVVFRSIDPIPYGTIEDHECNFMAHAEQI